jgi:uncharacterized membrane protein
VTILRRLGPPGVILLGVGVLIVVAVIVGVVDRPSGGGNGGGGGGQAVDAYLDEYGGSRSVYTGILAETDCDSLQASFDQAAANNDAATTSDQRNWTLGYMSAADDRMQAIGCY